MVGEQGTWWRRLMKTWISPRQSSGTYLSTGVPLTAGSVLKADAEVGEPQTVELGLVTEHNTVMPITAAVAATLPMFEATAVGTVGRPNDPDAAERRAASIGTRMPHLESGATEPPANLKLEDGSGNLKLEDGSTNPEVYEDWNTPSKTDVFEDWNTYPEHDGGRSAAATAIMSSSPVVQRRPHLEGGVTEPIDVDPQEIAPSVRRDFQERRVPVAARVRDARESTSALLITLDQLRLNSPEAERVQSLLQRQASTLDSVLALIEADEPEKAERTYRQLVDDILKGLFSVLAEEGVLRGIVAAAIVGLLGISGAYAALAGALITGSILGLDKKKLGEIIEKYRGKKD